MEQQIIDQLNAPLDRSLVHERKAGNGSVSYLEGHEAINQANRIFGYGKWGMKAEPPTPISIGGKWLYQALVTVTVDGALFPYTDIGTCPVSSDTQDGHDMAIKGAVTDGLKRALRYFGNQFGNSLYDKDAPRTTAARPQQSPAPARQSTPAADKGDTRLAMWLVQQNITNDQHPGFKLVNDWITENLNVSVKAFRAADQDDRDAIIRSVDRPEFVEWLKGELSAVEYTKPVQAPTNGDHATPAQINAIYAIGRREYRWSDEEMDSYCMNACGKAPADLGKREASELIDRLKATAPAA